MNVFNRRMFQGGGAVTPNFRTLFRKPDIKGYRDPKTVGFSTLEFENGKYYDRYRDVDNKLIKSKPVDISLSPTRDPRDAYMKMKQNEGISLGLSMVPIGVGTGAGLAGLGYAAGKTLPSVAKLTSPVLPALKSTGKAVPGKKGFQPRDPLDPTDYRAKFNPTGSIFSGLGVGGSQVPKLYAQPTTMDTTDPSFINAQYSIIQDPEASDQEKDIARNLIQKAISPNIQSDLDNLAAQETKPKIEQTPEGKEDIDPETKDDVEDELPPGSTTFSGKDDQDVDKLLKRNAKLLDLSSPRFLSAIRNIGAALVTTGRMGEGLAKGAADFAQEQAAKDLLREQSELEKQAKLEELLLEQSFKDTGLKASDAKVNAEFNVRINEGINNFEKTERDLSRLQYAIKQVDEGADGFRGLFGKGLDMLNAFTSQNYGTKFSDLEPRTQADAIINALKQQNIRDVLGESGRTISNLDREIVAEIFGSIKSTTPASAIKAKLKEIENRFRLSLKAERNSLLVASDYFQQTGMPSSSFLANKDLINKILNIKSFENYIPTAYNPDSDVYKEDEKTYEFRE